MKRLLCWILSLCLLLCLVPGAAAAERVTGTLERRAGYDLASVRCELADGSYFFASVEETAAGYAYAFDCPAGTYTVKPEYFSTTVWDGAVDISWYDASQTVFSIDTPAKLAGLAALVNGQVDAGTPDYRIKGDRELKTCLACQTQVEDNMYVATLPFFPLVKQVYDIEKVKPTEQIMMQLYPEIYACVGCNACTKSCTQGLNVMQYIAYAQRGEFDKCAEESFDCVMCGVCSSRCPAGISHPQVAMLARRLNGKYLAPKSEHLENRVREIENGTFDELMEALMGKPASELQELYNNRDIEK